MQNSNILELLLVIVVQQAQDEGVIVINFCKCPRLPTSSYIKLLHYSLSNTMTASPEDEYARIESSSSVLVSVCLDSSESHVSR